MKARSQPIPAPDGARFWIVDLGDAGQHHFRMPRFTLGLRVLEVTASTGSKGLDEKIRRLPAFAAAVGLSWHHRAIELETPEPDGTSLDDVRRYGEAVLDELQDRYSLAQLECLGAACCTEVIRRCSVVEEASQRSGFTPAAKSTPQNKAGRRRAPKMAPQESST